MFDFGYNDNAICNGIGTKSIMRKLLETIDTTPVPCRKKKVLFTCHQRIIIRFPKMRKKEGRIVNQCSLVLNKQLFL